MMTCKHYKKLLVNNTMACFGVPLKSVQEYLSCLSYNAMSRRQYPWKHITSYIPGQEKILKHHIFMNGWNVLILYTKLYVDKHVVTSSYITMCYSCYASGVSQNVGMGCLEQKQMPLSRYITSLPTTSISLFIKPQCSDVRVSIFTYVGIPYILFLTSCIHNLWIFLS